MKYNNPRSEFRFGDYCINTFRLAVNAFRLQVDLSRLGVNTFRLAVNILRFVGYYNPPSGCSVPLSG